MKISKKKLDRKRARLIEKACEIVGSGAELGRQLGVSRQFISQIIIDGNKFPLALARHVEKATDGKITKEELAPELYV